MTGHGVSKTLDTIRTRGHWRVLIRPAKFRDDKVPTYSQLLEILQKAEVSIRGWNFPHIDSRKEPARFQDHISQDFEWEHYLEAWRFYKSGQFLDFCGLTEDWRDRSTLWRVEPGSDWKPGAYMGWGGLIYRVTEIFEFAARLATAPAGDATMHVELGLRGLQRRRLWQDDPSRFPLFQSYEADVDRFEIKRDYSTVELAGAPREFAADVAQQILELFHWDVPLDFVRQYQAGFRP